MIRLTLTAARVLPVAIAAACIAGVGLITVGVEVITPVLPRGIPVSWLVAIASALIFSIVVRSPWDAYVASLCRPTPAQAVLVGAGLVLATVAYAPVLWSETVLSERLGWLILIATAAASVAIDARVAWLPVLIGGLIIEAANNLGGGELSRWLADHAAGVAGSAILVIAAGVAAILVRSRDGSWYR